MLISNEPTARRLRWPSSRRAARPQAAPTSLADKVFPPTPALAARLRALPARARTAWQARWPGRAKPGAYSRPRTLSRPRLLSAPVFWRRVGGQQLRSNRGELSLALRVSAWLSAVWHRLFVKLLRWSWGRRHSPLYGFAWRAVRKTLQAEWAETRRSFKMLASAYLLWQKAALKVAWWDLRRRFQRPRRLSAG